jgi:hypothetical protein
MASRIPYSVIPGEMDLVLGLRGRNIRRKKKNKKKTVDQMINEMVLPSGLAGSGSLART